MMRSMVRSTGRSISFPSTTTMPVLASVNAATILRAWAISSALGEKISLMIDLVGVDRTLAGEAQARAGLCFLAQAIEILEVEPGHVDRVDPGGCGRVDDP